MGSFLIMLLNIKDKMASFSRFSTWPGGTGRHHHSVSASMPHKLPATAPSAMIAFVPTTKKWYNYFVSVDDASQPSDPAQPPPDAGPSAAQTVADIAASIAVAPSVSPKMTNLPVPAASFDEIYSAAEIHP